MAISRKKKKWLGVLAVILVLGIVAAAYLPDLIYKKLYPLKYSEYVLKYAEEYEMDPYFIYAVIYSESRFRPDAVSHAGASGLMQLMPASFDWIKSRLKDDRKLTYEEHIFDPEINIQYGTYMLSLLLGEFKDRDVAVMAYHAGRGNIQSWLENEKYSSDGKTIHTIPKEDTQYYVDSVNKAYRIYTKLYPNE